MGNCNTIESLLGKTIKIIELNKDKDMITFIVSSREAYRLYHSQECCEGVKIEDICGDLGDLCESPILVAEEIISKIPSPEIIASRIKEAAKHKAKFGYEQYVADSETWTFYKISTIKGSVTIRWYGESNGYYSESVDFVRCV